VKAYSETIKAVEAAAHATVEPNNRKATLGSMIKVLRTPGPMVVGIGPHPAVRGGDGRADDAPAVDRADQPARWFAPHRDETLAEARLR